MKKLLAFIAILASLHLYANYPTPGDNREWAFFENLSYEEYFEKLQEMISRGHRPYSVDVVGGSERTYSLITVENREGYKHDIRTKLTESEYHDKWNEMKNQGYRPVIQRSYYLNNKLYYAGLWINDGVRWSSNRNLPLAEFRERVKSNLDGKYMPVDVFGYVKNGELYFTGIFVENTNNVQWIINEKIKADEFADHFDEMSEQGYRIHVNTSYTFENQEYYATIWINDGLRSLANRNMSKTSFYNYHNFRRDIGYRLHSIQTTGSGNNKQYLGIWVQNGTERLNWNRKSKVNEEVEKFLKANPLYKGLSVGVSVNGTIRFLRGYGFADESENKEAHSETIYRLASVSKAFAGTLAFMLEDSNEINLNDDVGSYLSQLPAHHEYQLRDLLSNRSGVRHYFSSDPVYKLKTVTAWEATQIFMNDYLVDCYQYSTHGYTIFAAALEERTGRDFCWHIRNSISTPHNLNSIDCEIISDNPPAERSEIFTHNKDENANVVPNRGDLSWKYAGGGLEGSAYDVLRFGMLLNQNELMTANRVSQMTTPPADDAVNYAYGWDTGTLKGSSYYGKGGGQTGSRSYILIIPDKDIVIVVLGNYMGNATRNLAMNIARLLF